MFFFLLPAADQRTAVPRGLPLCCCRPSSTSVTYQKNGRLSGVTGLSVVAIKMATTPTRSGSTQESTSQEPRGLSTSTPTRRRKAAARAHLDLLESFTVHLRYAGWAAGTDRTRNTQPPPSSHTHTHTVHDTQPAPRSLSAVGWSPQHRSGAAARRLLS
jgi:hypothetical protein